MALYIRVLRMGLVGLARLGVFAFAGVTSTAAQGITPE
jgi:hypothetical protein